jgi:hypothetical protein
MWARGWDSKKTDNLVIVLFASCLAFQPRSHKNPFPEFYFRQLGRVLMAPDPSNSCDVQQTVMVCQVMFPSSNETLWLWRQFRVQGVMLRYATKVRRSGDVLLVQ